MPQETRAGAADPPRDGPLHVGPLTFLFTDIEGSTRLLQEAGADYGGLLETHNRLLRAVFAAHGGREINTQGDSFFIVFAGPGQAVAAAAAGQRALAEHPWPPGRRVAVRMGLHTGEATWSSDSYVGLAVHEAARIAAVAHGRQVLLSEATVALVRERLAPGISVLDLGEHHLKDFARPAHLYQLLGPGLPTDFPPLPSRVRPNRLPSSPGSLVGRQTDVEAVAALLRGEEARLVTLTGPGGVGKSRLALEAARTVQDAFPGGVVFVPLAAVADASVVLSTVADAVGARREAGIDILDAVSAAVGRHRTLLVLDNFEHVMPATRDVSAVLERVPAVAALVTSRRVLRLRVERQYAVAPLTGSAAVELFSERAARLRPGLVLTEEDAAAVAEICRRLDGLPLAIELAAARTRLLPPKALLARMTQWPDALGEGPVDLPERQRTMRATMDWSYGLLRPVERVVLARLSVFAGGCTVEAAEEVCGGPGVPAVVDVLSELVESSLLVISEEPGEARLSLLETVRAHARDRLAAAPDREQVERRHTSWMLATAAALLRARGSEHREWMERLDREQHNLRAVARRTLHAGELATLALLVRDTFAYLAHRDAEREAVGWLDSALEQASDADPAVRGRLLVLRALAATVFGEFERARSLLTESGPLLPDDPDHTYDLALRTATEAYVAVAGHQAEAPRVVREAAARFAAVPHALGQAYMEVTGGNLALYLGDLEAAERHYATAVGLAEGLDDDAMGGRALSLLALTILTHGDTERARSSVIAGARANRRGGQPTSMAYSLDGLAAVALAAGRPQVAARALAAAQALRDRVGHPVSLAFQPRMRALASRLRSQLGDDQFEAVSAQGRAWDVVEALDRTLEALEDTAP